MSANTGFINPRFFFVQICASLSSSTIMFWRCFLPTKKEDAREQQWKRHLQQTQQLMRQVYDTDLRGHRVLAKCVQVIDGDTIRIVFFHPDQTDQIVQFKIRLAGINAPELHPRRLSKESAALKNERQKAQDSKVYLESRLKESKCGENLVLVQFGKMDKYGRALAYLYVDWTESVVQSYLVRTQLSSTPLHVTPIPTYQVPSLPREASLNHEMVEKGYAVSYMDDQS